MSQAWTLAPPALALAGAAACGMGILLAWRAGHRSAPLPLALALVLLGLSTQHPYGLFAPWFQQEPQSTRTLGVAVIVLALLSLFLVRSHQRTADRELPEEGRRLVQGAIVVGAVAVLTGLVLGFQAWFRSRDILLAGVSSHTVPLESIRAEAQKALLPWVVAFAVVLVLLPLAMALLVRAFLLSIRALAGAEHAVKDSLAKLQAVFENSMDGMFLYDTETRILDLNKAGCEILGLPREEILGHTFRELVDYQATDKDAVYRRLMHDEEAEGEMTFARRDGTTPVAEYRARANILPGLHLSVIRDLTERRLLEERLERARRLESLGVLAGGVAHDFNNLLMTILGSAELALEVLPADSRVRPELERIAATGRRATELTQQMLAYSGRTRPHLRSVRLDEAAAETVHLMAPLVPQHVTVVQDHATEQPHVFADPIQLRQVVLNLVTNALEAVGEGPGEVRVRTGPHDLSTSRLRGFEFTGEALSGAGVLLEVRDTGSGMTEEVRSKLFEPFFSTKFAGRGLGLAATLGVIRSHGGAIRVESAPGQGSTFQVFLPAAPAPTGTLEAPSPAFAGRPCILVADDEEDLLELLRAALSRKGFEILTARDGREALELFRSTPRIRAVLLDVKMPGLGGLETCRAMRAERPEVSVLLSTGYSELDTDREALDLGARAVLHKPFRVRTLVQHLREAIGEP